MSIYFRPAPQYIGRTIVTREVPGSAYDDRREAHQTTIIDASDPDNGGLTFQCDDGIAYRWQDEGSSWIWSENAHMDNPALNRHYEPPLLKNERSNGYA